MVLVLEGSSYAADYCIVLQEQTGAFHRLPCFPYHAARAYVKVPDDALPTRAYRGQRPVSRSTRRPIWRTKDRPSLHSESRRWHASLPSFAPRCTMAEPARVTGNSAGNQRLANAFPSLHAAARLRFPLRCCAASTRPVSPTRNKMTSVSPGAR